MEEFTDDPSLAIIALEDQLAQARAAGNTKAVQSLLDELSDLYYQLATSREERERVQATLAFAQTNGDREEELALSVQLGGILFVQGEYAAAIVQLTDALAVAKTLEKDPWGIFGMILLRSWSYLADGHLQEALSSLQQACAPFNDPLFEQMQLSLFAHLCEQEGVLALLEHQIEHRPLVLSVEESSHRKDHPPVHPIEELPLLKTRYSAQYRTQVLTLALHLYQQLHNHPREIALWYHLAYDAWYHQDFLQALRRFKHVLVLSEELNNFDMLAVTLKAIRVAYLQIGHEKEARLSPRLHHAIPAPNDQNNYAEQLRQARREGKREQEAYHLAGLARTSYEQGNLLEAIQYNQQALICFRAVGNQREVGRCYLHLASLLFCSKRTARKNRPRILAYWRVGAHFLFADCSLPSGEGRGLSTWNHPFSTIAADWGAKGFQEAWGKSESLFQQIMHGLSKNESEKAP